MALTIIVTLYMVLPSMISGKTLPGMESNDILGETSPWSNVPLCTHNTVCSYLQANAMGINKQPMCVCPESMGRCPFVWDSSDGHSITQGSDQYKYCGPAPELALCLPGQTAYRTVSRYSKLTWDIIERSESIQCICPQGFTYEPKDVKEQETALHHTIIGTYSCDRQQICPHDAPCKTIAETPESYLVTHKCSCPKGQACPTLSSRKSGTLEFFPGSAVKLVHCQ